MGFDDAKRSSAAAAASGSPGGPPTPPARHELTAVDRELELERRAVTVTSHGDHDSLRSRRSS